MESAEVESAKTGGDGWVSWVSVVPGSATGSEAVVVGVLGKSGTEEELVQKLPYAGGGAGVLLAELPGNEDGTAAVAMTPPPWAKVGASSSEALDEEGVESSSSVDELTSEDGADVTRRISAGRDLNLRSKLGGMPASRMDATEFMMQWLRVAYTCSTPSRPVPVRLAYA